MTNKYDWTLCENKLNQTQSHLAPRPALGVEKTKPILGKGKSKKAKGKNESKYGASPEFI